MRRIFLRTRGISNTFENSLAVVHGYGLVNLRVINTFHDGRKAEVTSQMRQWVTSEPSLRSFFTELNVKNI